MRCAFRKYPKDSEMHRKGMPGRRHFRKLAVSFTIAGGCPIANKISSALSHKIATYTVPRRNVQKTIIYKQIKCY